MKLVVHDHQRALGKSDLLVAFAFEGDAPQLPPRVKLGVGANKSFKGELRETRVVEADGPLPRVLLIGLGKRADLDAERLRRAGALAARRSELEGAANAAVWCSAELERAAGGAEVAGLALAEGARMGAYRFQRYKSKPKPEKLQTLALYGAKRGFKRGAKRGQVLAEANLFTRDLQNTPPNEMRPRELAAAARKLASNGRITCRVLGKPELGRLGMGALLGVSAGSHEPPALIHLTYKPRGKARAKVALVGKGLTFDAGGISIKPAAKMWDMKYDMSGGAAVLGAFHALRSIDVPFEVHGVVPASENLPDGQAIKPGDLVRAMNGTTIEVLNTDAEGRLILCDALSYCAAKIKPDTIIDLATLTGAVVVAVGHEYSGLFATTEALRTGLVRAGEAVGEKLWPLPLDDFHRDWMKGEVADLKNINNPDQGAGSTAGAAFLWHFVGSTEWAHIDIAGAAWGGMNRDWVGGPQGSGVGARLLVQYLMDRA
jgi:leucyl aminopeptidase